MRSCDMLRFSPFALRFSPHRSVCCVILSDERSEESKGPYTRQQTCVCRWLKPTPNQQKISGLNAGLKSVCENSIFTQPLVRPQIGKHNTLRKFLVLTH